MATRTRSYLEEPLRCCDDVGAIAEATRRSMQEHTLAEQARTDQAADNIAANPATQSGAPSGNGDYDDVGTARDDDDDAIANEETKMVVADDATDEEDPRHEAGDSTVATANEGTKMSVAVDATANEETKMVVADDATDEEGPNSNQSLLVVCLYSSSKLPYYCTATTSNGDSNVEVARKHGTTGKTLLPCQNSLETTMRFRSKTRRMTHLKTISLTSWRTLASSL
jgi:hypothetical protein